MDRIEKFLFIMIGILLIIFTALNFSFASEPKFKLHIVQLDGMKGVNYSINYPVVIDYDQDGDLDVLIMLKEGTLYFLENITNEVVKWDYYQIQKEQEIFIVI